MLDLIVFIEQVELGDWIHLQHFPFDSQIQGVAEEFDVMVASCSRQTLRLQLAVEGLNLLAGNAGQRQFAKLSL
jgi:hypothetical protein